MEALKYDDASQRLEVERRVQIRMMPNVDGSINGIGKSHKNPNGAPEPRGDLWRERQCLVGQLV